MSNIPSVLIVGAGPTGLTMAVELKRRNISFRIIDKANKPVKTSNALVVQTRTLEMWDDEYLLSQAEPQGIKITQMNFHFNNNVAENKFAFVNTTTPYILGLAQHQTEKLLIDYLKKKEIKIEMTELISFVETSDGITATLQAKDGDREECKVKWLLACDGSHSLIRTQCNIDFLGKELPQHFVFADIKFENPLPQDQINMFLNKNICGLIPFAKDTTRMIADVTGDPELGTAKSLTDEQVLQLLTTRISVPLTIDKILWTSGFWIHERIAARYRQNHIFLLGDAAHVHSPAGGQGMNTGMQDAYNLAWKLALVINNKAPDSLLDSYQVERYPVALEVLKNSTRLTAMVTTRNSFLAKLRNAVLQRIFKFTAARQLFTGMITELNIQYQHSPLTQDCLPRHSGPKPGERMIDIDFGDRARFIDPIRGTKFRLLIFVGKVRNLEKYFHFQNRIKQLFPGIIKFVLINQVNDFSFWDEKKVLDERGILHEKYGASSPLFYLIRPDKYLCFRGDLGDEQALITYLKKILIPNDATEGVKVQH